MFVYYIFDEIYFFVKKIAIFGSGSGSNAENIFWFFSKSLDIRVVLFVTNNNESLFVKRAKKINVPVCVINKKELENYVSLHKVLMSNDIDFIVLAGFLLKIPVKMVSFWDKKIINIHPSLLPKYGGKGMYGKHVHESVIKNKETESGITIHLVNEKYDDGAILFQKSCPVSSNEDLASLTQKVRALEHKYFPLIIKKHLSNDY